MSSLGSIPGSLVGTWVPSPSPARGAVTVTISGVALDRPEVSNGNYPRIPEGGERERVRLGEIRQLVFILERRTHWQQGREISTESICEMACWLRSPTMYKKERVKEPTTLEAWAAARVFARRTEWDHKGEGADQNLNSLIRHELEEIAEEKESKHSFKSRSDFYPGSMVYGNRS